jgi:hypothetical protein
MLQIKRYLEMPDIYSVYEERLLKELGGYEDNAVVGDLTKYKLPNTSETTEFDDWGVCLEQSIRRNAAAVEEWGLLRRREAFSGTAH